MKLGNMALVRSGLVLEENKPEKTEYRYPFC